MLIRNIYNVFHTSSFQACALACPLALLCESLWKQHVSLSLTSEGTWSKSDQSPVRLRQVWSRSNKCQLAYRSMIMRTHLCHSKAERLSSAFKILFIFIYLNGSKMWREKQKAPYSASSLPKCLQQCGWARLKQRSWHSLLVSCVGYRNANTPTITCCLPECILAESWKWNGPGTQTQAIRLGRLWQTYFCCTTAPDDLSISPLNVTSCMIGLLFFISSLLLAHPFSFLSYQNKC